MISAAAFLPWRYQMSTWSVPSCRRLSSRWARASAFVPPPGLRRDEDLVAPALEGRADEPLVVAALVAARGVEEVHAEVGGALDDALVRGDHAAEGDLGDLEAGLAELALADDGRAAAGAGAIAGGAGFGASIDAWAAAGRARPVRAEAVRNSRRERGLDMAALLRSGRIGRSVPRRPGARHGSFGYRGRSPSLESRHPAAARCHADRQAVGARWPHASRGASRRRSGRHSARLRRPRPPTGRPRGTRGRAGARAPSSRSSPRPRRSPFAATRSVTT